MLEHVFVAETAVAAGNGCVGGLGVLWLPLGDTEWPFGGLPKSTYGARTPRDGDGVDRCCDETACPVIRSETTLTVAIERGCEHSHAWSAVASHRPSR